MGEVEIVVKVPEGVPKEVVERYLKRRISKVNKIRKYKGILKGVDVDKLLQEVENEWGEF